MLFSLKKILWVSKSQVNAKLFGEKWLWNIVSFLKYDSFFGHIFNVHFIKKIILK
jgi:hypothetical protein